MFEEFIQPVPQSTTHLPDETVQIAHAPAVWTLAHRGYSGAGRLDVWAYPSQQAALRAGAELALACGFDDDRAAIELFASGRYRDVLAYYEQHSPADHLLRVCPAWLQDIGGDDPPGEGLTELTGASRAEPRPPFETLFAPQQRSGRPAEDDQQIGLTPRNAAVLWHCALQAADDAEADLAAFGSAPVSADDPVGRRWLIFDEYPAITYGQDAAWRRQARMAFLNLAGDLEDGRLPLPRCPAEELALHLMLHAAASWPEDVGSTTARRLLADLPAAAEDGDWDYLREALFRDHDILTLYEPAAAGIEDPADPRNRMLAIGDYRPAAWFTIFRGAEPRPRRSTPPV